MCVMYPESLSIVVLGDYPASRMRHHETQHDNQNAVAARHTDNIILRFRYPSGLSTWLNGHCDTEAIDLIAFFINVSRSNQ